jgi:hypothetical protein
LAIMLIIGAIMLYWLIDLFVAFNSLGDYLYP